jgi:hypothetical protein
LLPGVPEADEFGWYRAEGGKVIPDLGRLFNEAVWDREARRFVLPEFILQNLNWKRERIKGGFAAQPDKTVPVYIELRAGRCEKLWATPVSDKVVRLENIPYYRDEFGFGDLVSITGCGQIEQVVQCNGQTRHWQLESADHWPALAAYLEGHNIPAELHYGERFGMVLPLATSVHREMAILDGSRVDTCYRHLHERDTGWSDKA